MPLSIRLSFCAVVALLASPLFAAPSAVTAAPTKAASSGAPNCARPADFSVSKDVAVYEDCVKKRDDFCETHEKDPGCVRAALEMKKRKVWGRSQDVDTQAHCSIQRDGSYQCDQEPIRFLYPEEETAAPQPAPSVPKITIDGQPAAPAAPGLPTVPVGIPGGAAAPPPPVAPPPSQQDNH